MLMKNVMLTSVHGTLLKQLKMARKEKINNKSKHFFKFQKVIYTRKKGKIYI